MTFNVRCEYSSLVRPMLEALDVERAVMADDRVEDDLEQLGIDEVAFGLDDFARPLSVSHE